MILSGAFLGLLALPFGPIGMVVLGALGAGIGTLIGLVLDKREVMTIVFLSGPAYQSQFHLSKGPAVC